jgi:hypothetical protein
MRGLFVTTNSNTDSADDILAKIATNWDKVAVQDSMPIAHELITKLNERGINSSVWTASPDDTTRLLSYGAKQIIVQGEDNQADASILNVAALRTNGFNGLLSVVSNLWPSRCLPWWDAYMHKNSIRLLPECYLPENPNQTVAAMVGEGIRRGYPTCQGVLGCYWGFGLKDYLPLPRDYWIWDAAQMLAGDWARPRDAVSFSDEEDEETAQ